MHFPECNLDATKESYNWDPSIPIHLKKNPLCLHVLPVMGLVCMSGRQWKSHNTCNYDYYVGTNPEIS